MEPHQIDRLRALEQQIVDGIRRVKEAKDDLKDANAELDGAYEALREYARELSDPQKTPLFDQVDQATGEIVPAAEER